MSLSSPKLLRAKCALLSTAFLASAGVAVAQEQAAATDAAAAGTAQAQTQTRSHPEPAAGWQAHAPQAKGQAAPVAAPNAYTSKIFHDFNFKAYFSPSAGFKQGGNKVGNATLERYSFDYKLRYTAAEGLYLTAGVFGNYMSIDADDSVWLPDRLQALGFSVGASKDLTGILGKGWVSNALLRPVFTTDTANFSDPGFVLQGAWTVSYRSSETMTWTGGVVFTTHANNSVLPVVGLRWDFAQDWTAFIGFPEASVSYQLMEDLTLRGLVTFMQGSYKIKSAPGPGLGDTYLDYREIRVGVGADYNILENLSLGLDLGAVVDRRFNYYKRGYDIKGNTAAYFNITLNLEL